MRALMGTRLPVSAALLALLAISVGAVAAEVEKPPPSPVVQGGKEPGSRSRG